MALLCLKPLKLLLLSPLLTTSAYTPRVSKIWCFAQNYSNPSSIAVSSILVTCSRSAYPKPSWVSTYSAKPSLVWVRQLSLCSQPSTALVRTQSLLRVSCLHMLVSSLSRLRANSLVCQSSSQTFVRSASLVVNLSRNKRRCLRAQTRLTLL